MLDNEIGTLWVASGATGELERNLINEPALAPHSLKYTVQSFYTSLDVIRLISRCLFLHFHAWSSVGIIFNPEFHSFFAFLSRFEVNSPRYTKKGQKSKKIIGLIILYACHECALYRYVSLCAVRERGEVGTGEGKRHEWEVHLSNFTMNLFTIYTPTIDHRWMRIELESYSDSHPSFRWIFHNSISWDKWFWSKINFIDELCNV